jgi:hypothetical protein
MPPPANPTSLLIILERDPAPNTSGTYSGVIPRGLALGAAASGPLNALDFQQFDLAQPTNYIGLITRDVSLTGPGNANASVAEAMIFGNITGTGTPTGVEFPFKSGLSVTVEPVRKYEAEGPTYLYSGTAGSMITTGTPVGTDLTFINGLLAVVTSQSTQNTYFTLIANNLTPNVAGNLRVRVQAA